MNTAVDRFEVALGEEDGNHFAAILWPEGMGKVAFQGTVQLMFTEDGFALHGVNDAEAMKFSGIDPSIIQQMGERHVVLLEKAGLSYEQFEVVKLNNPV
jgi:hypothetical protein